MRERGMMACREKTGRTVCYGHISGWGDGEEDEGYRRMEGERRRSTEIERIAQNIKTCRDGEEGEEL